MSLPVECEKLKKDAKSHNSHSDESMLFSVIIPCYCDGAFAIEAIESLLTQIDTRSEIIFVDDGSPDNSYDLVVSRFSETPNVHCFKIENGGVSLARNFGFLQSKGEWVIFLDSDDLLAVEFLKKAAEHISKNIHGDNAIIVMPFCYFDMPGSSRAKWVERYRPPILSKSKALNLFKLSVTNCFPISSAVVARQLAKSTGLFNSSLSHYEDWELWLKLAKKGAEFHYVEPDVKHATFIRIRKGVSSNSKRMMVARDQIAAMYFDGTPMQIWRLPLIGDYLRKMCVGFWKLKHRKSASHPNVTSWRNTDDPGQ